MELETKKGIALMGLGAILFFIILIILFIPISSIEEKTTSKNAISQEPNLINPNSAHYRINSSNSQTQKQEEPIEPSKFIYCPNCNKIINRNEPNFAYAPNHNQIIHLSK